jgi:hypothetical protein
MRLKRSSKGCLRSTHACLLVIICVRPIPGDSSSFLESGAFRMMSRKWDVGHFTNLLSTKKATRHWSRSSGVPTLRSDARSSASSLETTRSGKLPSRGKPSSPISKLGDFGSCLSPIVLRRSFAGNIVGKYRSQNGVDPEGDAA